MNTTLSLTGHERSGAQKVSEIQALFSLLSVRLQPMREAMLKAYNYAVGDQIAPDVRAELNRLNRPEIIFNYIHNIILSVAGYIYSERKAMKAVPMRMGDEKGAGMHTVLVSDFAVGDDGYMEIAKGTVDAAIAKYGVVQSYWTTRGNPEGRVVVESCDPFSILFDTDARKTPDGGPDSDWRYYQFTRWMDCEELIMAIPSLDEEKKARLREKAAALEAASGTDRASGKPRGWFSRIVNGMTQFWNHSTYNNISITQPLVNDWTNARNGTYRVVEHHDKRIRTEKSIYDPVARKTVNLSADVAADPVKLDMEKAKYPAGQVFEQQVEELWKTVICPALMQDDVLMEEPYEVQGRGWQHKMIVCYDWHPDMTKMQGMVDAMVSPQDAINQREMSWLEFVLDLMNPQTEYRKGTIGPDQLQAWEQNLRGALLEHNGGPNGEKPTRMYPNSDVARLLVENKQDNADKMYKLSGVSPNLGGQEQTANESGVLFSNRVQAALFNLSTIATHQGNTMRHLFGYIDELLQQYLTLPRAVRLLSEPPEDLQGVDPAQAGSDTYYWLRLNWPTLDGVLNDVTQGQYDFRVDMTQLGPTAKRLKFAEAVEVMNTLPPELKPYHLFVRQWDSPDAAEWAKYVEERMGIAAQTASMEQAAAAEKLKNDVMQGRQDLQFSAAERTRNLLQPQPQGQQ